jgi:CubicO group peptidase (beta-lactamase class C family)
LKTKLLIYFFATVTRIAIAQTADSGQIKLVQKGLDSLKLEKINKNIKKGFYGKVTSVVVYHDSNVVFEKYYNGAKPNDLLTMRSGMKSITALLIGIAIKEQLIKSENEPVINYFRNEEILNLDDRKKAITISDILKMSSGLEWHEVQPPIPDPKNSIVQMVATKDQGSFVLNQKMDTLPNVRFQYNSGHSEILDKIILTSTGKTTPLYAKEKLFIPLGISDFYWKDGSFTEKSSNKIHYNKKEISLNLKSIDMLKLGVLVLNKGKWNNQQLIDTTWLNKTFENYFISSPLINYGYQWYICNYPSGFTVYNTAGGGDQYINVIPALNMVIVMTGKNFSGDNKNNGLLRFHIMQSNSKFKSILLEKTNALLKLDTVLETSFGLSVISRDLFECGFYNESIKITNMVISRNDATYRSYLRNGMSYNILGQQAMAMESFKKAISLNPGKTSLEKQDNKYCKKQIKNPTHNTGFALVGGLCE